MCSMRATDPFKGKQVLVLGSGADCIVPSVWLLDRDVQVTITDRAAIRGIQGHLRATAVDGQEYERRKSYLACMDLQQASATLAAIDLVVARSSVEHAIVQQARERGIPVTSRGELARAFPLPPQQKIIHRSDALTVVDDTGALSPERGLVSVRQWGGPNCVLIAGGEGRKSDYRLWADTVVEQIRPTNLVLLAGSATDAMRKALGTHGRGIRTYDSLEQCWRAAQKRSGLFISSVVLFSPAARSSESFSALVERALKRR
jgi:UDP-N-acetylmuramoylalanine-D-glutamate ligase